MTLTLLGIASDPPACPACAYRAGFSEGVENASAVASALGHVDAARGIRNLVTGLEPPTLSEARAQARAAGRPVHDIEEEQLPW